MISYNEIIPNFFSKNDCVPCAKINGTNVF